VRREISKPKRDEVTVDWRKLGNEDFHNLYSSPNIIRIINEENEVVGTCSMHGTDYKYVHNSVSKREEKRPLGRPRGRW
jgi:hypothetical protein